MFIGTYQQSQRSQLIDLLLELAQHYDRGLGSRSEVAAHLDNRILAVDSPITLATAVDTTGRVLGLAALVLMPSIFEVVGPDGHQCNLKELYVTGQGRSNGVGAALLRWSASFAIEHGCGRLDWHVKATNAAGIRFYERHGAQIVPDRASYRLEGEALASLATAGSLT